MVCGSEQTREALEATIREVRTACSSGSRKRRFDAVLFSEGGHRGTVDATSAGVGQGSEFTVRLPTVEG